MNDSFYKQVAPTKQNISCALDKGVIMGKLKYSNTVFLFIIFFSISTLNAQSGWFPLTNAPISHLFTDIYFINADTGFVYDLNLGGFKTSDGGQTWNSVVPFGNIRFFNQNRLGYWGFYRTIDSGLSWVRDSGVLKNVSFPSDSVGFTCGMNHSDTSTLLFGKTTDQGKTWKYWSILPVKTGSIVDYTGIISFRDEKNGFVDEGVYNQSQEFNSDVPYFTSDGGLTWSENQRGPTTPFQYVYLHDSTWIATSAGFNIIEKSHDDFVTQKLLNSFITFPNCQGGTSYALSKFDNNNIVAIGRMNYGAIYRSTNAGDTWYAQKCFQGGSIPPYGAISLPTKLVGYAVGIDSQIYKTIDGGGPPFSNDVKKTTDKSSFSLYSNPITTFADFQFSPLKEPETFALFDLIGRQFLRREVSIGEASLHVDMQQYPAGVYLARLGGETVRFAKM